MKTQKIITEVKKMRFEKIKLRFEIDELRKELLHLRINALRKEFLQLIVSKEFLIYVGIIYAGMALCLCYSLLKGCE